MTDETYIQLCCALALRGRGTTAPNPIVGALVVSADGIVGTGYHSKAGGPHAEVVALTQAGERCRGSTLYVSLEPCCHYGQTPPCTDAIIASGIERVVVGELDPDPRVRGRGVAALRSAGIDVKVMPVSAAVRRLNLAFRRRSLTGRPLVTYKYACSLDGKTATRARPGLHLTGDAADRYVHALRADHDAIIVGVNTVIADDPRLTVRREVCRRQPRPVVFDARGSTPPTARLFSGPAQPIIVVTELATPERVAALAKAGAEIVVVNASPDGRCDPDQALAELCRRGIDSALLEGGGELAASFLGVDAIDRIAAIITPRMLGGRSSPSVLGGDQSLNVALGVAGRRDLGPDLLIAAWPDRGGEPACLQASWSAWDRSLASAALLEYGQ